MKPSSSSTELARAGFIARHPRLTLLGVLAGGMLALGLIFELGLRAFGSMNISYYTGTREPGVHRYPYGDVPINSFGYPDEEFVLSSPKWRIGYVGDSVTYGIGAGYSYRIPDLLQQQYPQTEHWVFAGVGERLEEPKLLGLVDQFKLDSVVYLLNLNDVVPDADSAEASSWIASSARTSWLGSLDLMLRGRSYLYTYLRFGVKNAMERRGWEHHGMTAFELVPGAHPEVIEATGRRVAAALASAARGRELRTCVVLLPYEMQISADAARTYRELGFSWEAGFESGSTQRALLAVLSRHGITAFDAIEAFRGLQLKVGETFVYNKGDRTDWNHPNRRGHEILTNWLAAQPGFTENCLGLRK